MRRVAITGMGALCANGHNLEDTWESLLSGRSGISYIEQFDTEKFPVRIAGEVKGFSLSHNLLSEKEQSRLDRFVLMALHSAHEAMVMSGLEDNLAGYPPEHVGAIIGVGMGGFSTLEKNYALLFERGPKRISPFLLPAIIPNMATGFLSILHGFKGVNYTIASACASSAHAIDVAANEIRTGRQDVVISGGSESVLVGITIAGFANMKALSRWNDRPTEASRPFDKERNGFVMGEGAGILVLEDFEKARARGAKIYAELAGSGFSSDAHHVTAPHPEGEQAIRCMRMALKSAGIEPQQVGYINAHGTSTPLGDKAETLAIKKTFGNHAKNLLISSTKSMTGHLLGGAGGIESIFCIMALATGDIPPTINLQTPDPECDLNYVPNEAKHADLKYVLNNSFGFGGTNSSLIFKKVDN